MALAHAADFIGDNRPRFVSARAAGHVESFFLRANDRNAPRALWLKATVRIPRAGEPVAEAWGALFDSVSTRASHPQQTSRSNQTLALRETIPLRRATFAEQPLDIHVGNCRFLFGPQGGQSTGSLESAGETLSWDLSWTVEANGLGAPLCLYPSRTFVDGPFPKFKILTPAPLLVVSGHVEVAGERHAVERWIGMQGHNWGVQHTHRYSWGQCIFLGADGEPLCMAEGFTGQLRLGGVVTPHFSALEVRRGDRKYRFARVLDFGRQRVDHDDLRWAVRLRGPDGEAMLAMQARPEQIVCLGYRDPDGSLAHCLNSKLAQAVLRVNPVNEEPFECSSAHGGALEFLQREPDPRFPPRA